MLITIHATSCNLLTVSHCSFPLKPSSPTNRHIHRLTYPFHSTSIEYNRHLKLRTLISSTNSAYLPLFILWTFLVLVYHGIFILTDITIIAAHEKLAISCRRVVTLLFHRLNRYCPSLALYRLLCLAMLRYFLWQSFSTIPMHRREWSWHLDAGIVAYRLLSLAYQMLPAGCSETWFRR